ncbi:uncharacterized protein LOC134531004 isoform X1 [Bacillus rossius redtenbacheri]|uniref:uncharacterized protein LOC134531004 isoform X1 n=1 Tax=Bacillus rossius redtenbacheri TaxID=93214 RepID=UPI002FDD9BBF
MGDMPGVRTRLQEKRMTLSDLSPKKSLRNTEKIIKNDRVLRRSRQSSSPKAIGKKSKIDVTAQNKISEVVTDSSNDTCDEESQGNKFVKSSPNKTDLIENIRKSPRGKTKSQPKKDIIHGFSSNENPVPAKPNTPSRCSVRLLRARLSLSESKIDKKNTSANRSSLHTDGSRKFSHTSISSMKAKPNERKMPRKSQKRKVNYTSDSDSFEKRSSEKEKTSPYKISSRKSPRKNDLVQQDEINSSIGPSNEKPVVTRKLFYENSNASDNMSITVRDGKEETSEKLTTDITPTGTVRRHQKNLNYSQSSDSEDGRNSPLDTATSVVKSSTEENNSVTASQRLSPDSTSVGNTGSLQSTPCKKNSSEYEYSSEGTFEVITEKASEESKISLRLNHENSDTQKNFGNGNKSNNLEISDFDDAISNENLVLGLNNAPMTKCNITEDKKLCLNEDKSSIQKQASCEKNVSEVNESDEDELTLQSFISTRGANKLVETSAFESIAPAESGHSKDKMANADQGISHSPNSPCFTPKSPLQSSKSPLQSSKSPLQSSKSPLQSSKSPLQSSKSPLQSSRSPLQSSKSPLQSSKSPLQSSKSPSPFSKSPLQSSKSPSPFSKSPSPFSKSPSPSSQSPSQSLKSTSQSSKPESSKIPSQFSKGPNKSDDSALYVSLDTGLVVEHCNEKSFLKSDISYKSKSSPIQSSNNDHLEKNEDKNEESISQDDSDFGCEVMRRLIERKSVDETAKVTNYVTLDSDESSEFTVIEVQTQEINHNRLEAVAESVENYIEIKGMSKEAEDESTEDESGNENEDDGIEIIDTTVKNNRVENKEVEVEPVKKFDGPSLLNKVLDDASLSLHKEKKTKHKLLIKKSVSPKCSNNNFQNSLTTGILEAKTNKILPQNQSEIHKNMKDNKTSCTSSVSTTKDLNSTKKIYKTKNVATKCNLSQNSDPNSKVQNYLDSFHQLAKKLKKKKNIAASNVLEPIIDISSSDREEIVDLNTMLKHSDTNTIKSKVNSKSSVSGSRNLPESVSAKSHIQGKHGLVRTETKCVEDLESDSDAESRKRIHQKAEMMIAEYVAESAGSNSKHATSDDAEVFASLPGNVGFTALGRPDLQSQGRMDSSWQQKQLLKKQRRKLLDRLKQQKEEKLNRLKERVASKEDASCSSSESSADERERRDSAPLFQNSFIVSDNKVARQDGGNFNVTKKKKKKKNKKQMKINQPVNVVDVIKLQCRATTQWIVEDLAKSSSKLRRLPEDILSQLDGGQPRHCLPKATAVVKDTHKQTKRKHWKDTGHSVDGFHVTTDADFIPLETGTTVQFGVMPLNKMGKAAPALAKASADFRQNMLYGSRIRREPAKTLLDRQLKLKAAHKDSLVKRTH